MGASRASLVRRSSRAGAPWTLPETSSIARGGVMSHRRARWWQVSVALVFSMAMSCCDGCRRADRNEYQTMTVVAGAKVTGASWRFFRCGDASWVPAGALVVVYRLEGRRAEVCRSKGYVALSNGEWRFGDGLARSDGAPCLPLRAGAYEVFFDVGGVGTVGIEVSEADGALRQTSDSCAR